MALYNLTNATTPDGILVGLSTSVPALPIMLLLFVWMITFVGGVTRESARKGYADASQWAVLSSLSTLLLALMMTITAGIISITILATVVAITILSAVWFFLSQGRFE